MVTFFTNRTASFFRGILTLALGICLLMWPEFTSGLIVKLIAAFLLAAGIITLVFALSASSKSNTGVPALVVVNIAVYLVFGLLVFIFPNFFLSLIAFLFGAVLLIGGISQICNLYYSSKYTNMSGGLYIVPIIITICGIALFFTPKASTEVLTMIFGGAVALYGIMEIVSWWKFRNVIYSRIDKESSVEDVSFEEVENKE